MHETEEKKYLLSDETYQKLRNAQKRINNEVDVTPNLRKLINNIIDDAAIDDSINHFIELYKQV